MMVMLVCNGLDFFFLINKLYYKHHLIIIESLYYPLN